jgi:ornithine cyclodeaminase/alanine dehydrogenase-like protein (mu-crystallin family)
LTASALREFESRTQHAEEHTFSLQASNILNEAYTQKLNDQLATQEEKRERKNILDDSWGMAFLVSKF